MSVQQNIYRQRHSFSKIRSLVPIPNLIDIQKRSYDEFLQMNLLHGERENRGLRSVFDSMDKLRDAPVGTTRLRTSPGRSALIRLGLGRRALRAAMRRVLHHDDVLAVHVIPHRRAQLARIVSEASGEKREGSGRSSRDVPHR